MTARPLKNSRSRIKILGSLRKTGGIEKMAQRGRKAEPPEVKAARGTARPSRDTHALVETASPALPIEPPDLPYDVAVVWAEYVDAAVSHGARQCDADSFAEWCTMTANLRRARMASGSDEDGGGLPPASYIQQWRTLGEMFGLCGPKSRMMARSGQEAGKSTNPFARNGRKN